MTELFKKHKKAFIRQLGKGALDDGQLDALGKEMLSKKYIGTFAQDEMPNRSGYLIVNVDTSKKINTDKAHWVAIYQTPKTVRTSRSKTRQIQRRSSIRGQAVWYSAISRRARQLPFAMRWDDRDGHKGRRNQARDYAGLHSHPHDHLHQPRRGVNPSMGA